MSNRKNESSFEDFVNWYMEWLLRSPWWAGGLVSVAVYLLLRFVLPPAGILIGNPIISGLFLGFSKTAGFISSIFVLGWFCAEIAKPFVRRKFDRTRNLEDIKALPWDQFETYIGEYYRRKGWKIEHTGKAAPDGGVDLRLRQDRELRIVQCKHWKVYQVGVAIIREIFGVMIHENAAAAIIVTSGSFSSDAKEFAKDKPLELIDGIQLIPMIREVQNADAAPRKKSPSIPRCPRCDSAMSVKRAGSGPKSGKLFWGCSNFPECRGSRDYTLEEESG